MIAAVSLNPSIDFYFRVAKLHAEDTTRAESTVRMAGGKSLNVVRVLHGFGAKAKLFAFTAGSAGKDFENLTREARLPLSVIRIFGETRTNVVIFDRSEQSDRRVSGNAPRATHAQAMQLGRVVAAARPKFAVLNGALPEGLKPSIYSDLTVQLTAKGIRVIVDADGEALRAAVRGRVKPFCIKPNEHELERLVGRPLRSVSAVARAAISVSKLGIPHVIASMGPRGAIFVHKGLRPFLIEPPKSLKIQSRVAAGDSLLSGFLYSVERGVSAGEASCFAIAAASSCVAQPSGTFAKLSQTRSFLSKLTITHLR